VKLLTYQKITRCKEVKQNPLIEKWY